MITEKLFVVFWALAVIFLTFGIIHLIMVHRKYFKAHQRNRFSMLTGEIIFSLSIILFTVAVFSSLQYFLKDRSFLFFPMLMSILAFFIPVLFLHTFNAAFRIPPPEYTTWAYPVTQPISLPPEDPKEKLLVIGFEIAKKQTDARKTYFRARAPENMTLGDLYYHFINDYNELHSETTIQYALHDSEPHEWWFRNKPKWYQWRRILDPDKTIRENRIKENTVIICERFENTALPKLT